MLILLNKPFRVLSQFRDPDGRPTLGDYVDVPDVYPAGRLDYDSEGLILLTDDGRLQARISHPKARTRKTYWAQVEGVPSAEQLDRALKLDVTAFASLVFENQGDGRFRRRVLPVEAQFAPVQDVIVADFDRDGRKDLLLAGNDFGNRAEEGPYDAGRGLLLLGMSGLDFRPVPSRESGFLAPWDVRELRLVNTRIGTLVLVANNNASVAAFGVLGR